MDVVRAVHGRATRGEVGGVREEHRAARLGDAVHAHARSREDPQGLRVEFDAGHDVLVPLTAPGVAVDLLDEFADGALAVADDVGGHALRDRDDLAAHDEDAVVAALVVLLHHHLPSVRAGLLEAPAHLFGRAEVQAHAAPVVAVERFGHDGPTHACGLTDGLVGVTDDRAARDGHAHVGEEAFREVLVARGERRDVRGEARDARAEAAPVASVPELDQAALVETGHGDAAPARGPHERVRGGSEGGAAHETPQRVHARREVELRRGEGGLCGIVVQDAQTEHAAQLPWQEGVHEAQREQAREEGDVLVAVGVHDGVDTRLTAHAARLAVGGAFAREALEFERDVLRDVAEPRAVPHAPYEPAGLLVGAAVVLQGRDLTQQRVREAGQGAGGPRLQRAEVEDEAHHGPGGVHVRAPVHAALQDAHRAARRRGGGGGARVGRVVLRGQHGCFQG